MTNSLCFHLHSATVLWYNGYKGLFLQNFFNCSLDLNKAGWDWQCTGFGDKHGVVGNKQFFTKLNVHQLLCHFVRINQWGVWALAPKIVLPQFGNRCEIQNVLTSQENDSWVSPLMVWHLLTMKQLLHKPLLNHRPDQALTLSLNLGRELFI